MQVTRELGLYMSFCSNNMAEYNGSQLTVDWWDLRTDVLNMSDWTNGNVSNQNDDKSEVDGNCSPDSDSDHQKRSDIVHAIIHNHSLDHLQYILVSGWDVNEILRIPQHEIENTRHDAVYTFTLRMTYRRRTALAEAAREGWTEAVKMLLDAGAKYTTLNESENPLKLALQHHNHFPGELIGLLLHHGADPNDHDGAIPLIEAIKSINRSKNLRIVQLLLKCGADPNVNTGTVPHESTLHVALSVDESELWSALFTMLIKFGADINFGGPGRLPLLHKMMCHSHLDCCFRQNQLDLFFTHRININIEHEEEGAVLEDVVRSCGHCNNIRWLIRHGADTSNLNVTLFKGHFIPTFQGAYFPDTPLILLQAGMRVSLGAQRQLSNMELAISAYLQENGPCNDYRMDTSIQAMWDQLVKTEQAELQCNLRKYRFPENGTYCGDSREQGHTMWAQIEKVETQRLQCYVHKSTLTGCFSQQMDDLQEFSDESLDVYPEVSAIKEYTILTWQDCLDQIHIVLEFLNQPQSLQFYCRRCVRENLVSLQPSVVKTLPIPARLKRHILCHEI